MIHLHRALRAWGTPDFARILEREVEQLGLENLPLQQALSRSSYALSDRVRAMVMIVSGGEARISARVGIFYTGVISGCSCADDPTPIDENIEFCEVRIDIDRLTGETRVSLLEEEDPRA